ncbi:MAG: GAF domain-containing protein [Phycisphaerales bacterium]
MNTRPAIVRRNYEALLARHELLQPRPVVRAESARVNLMERAIAMLWDEFKGQSLSWIGFYQKVESADEMVLVCREPKPACSPIGLHGMCGRGWAERRSIVIQNVRTLGENYIACDPKDQSEVVVPVMNEDGTCWGVLDADSYDIAGFDEGDAAGMLALLEAMGIGAGGVGVARM